MQAWTPSENQKHALGHSTFMPRLSLLCLVSVSTHTCRGMCTRKFSRMYACRTYVLYIHTAKHCSLFCSSCIHSRLVRTHVYVSTHMHTYTRIYIYYYIDRLSCYIQVCMSVCLHLLCFINLVSYPSVPASAFTSL